MIRARLDTIVTTVIHNSLLSRPAVLQDDDVAFVAAFSASAPSV
jgi:hypothetical protein